MAIDILQCFTEEPPPLDFVLPGFLSGTVGALVAPGGAGKSTFILEAAAALAAGVAGGDVLGLGIQSFGPVLYLAAEDPPAAIWHRLHALGRHFGPDVREAVAERLTIESLLGEMPDLMNAGWQQAIIEGAQGKRLVILDTLTRFHTLDENDNGAMGGLVAVMEHIAKRADTTLLYLHHSSKAMAIAGRTDEQQSARGASALIDNARWCGYVSGMTKDEAKGYGIDDDERGFYCKFGISKQNYGVPFGEKWLMRGQGGILEPVELSPIKAPNLSNKSKSQNGDDNDNW